MREKILFDNGWVFHEGDFENKVPQYKGPIYSSTKTQHMVWGPASRNYLAVPDHFTTRRICIDKWEHVTLPHDYIIKQTPDENQNNALGYFKYTNAWYRKNFNLPEEDKGKRLTILFEGIATHSTIYVNGCVLKHNFCGYNSFEVDITDFVKYGEGAENENLLAVYTNSDDIEGWWYQGAGIYRHVWLIKTDSVAVDLWGVYAMPVQADDGTWDVNAEVTVVNSRYEDVPVKAVTAFYDAESKLLASACGEITVEEKSKATAKYSMKIENPVLWDLENPYLYRVETKLYVNGEETDCYEIRTGFRNFKLDPDKGLFLNGKSVKIKGVCAHQDFGLTGKAVPDNIHRYKIEMIKEMGANGYRTSHYPHPEVIMDALDELGFIVMDETRWFSSSEDSMEQLEMLVKRDRNRPSVLFWSLGNEEPYHVIEEGRRICKSMMSLVKKLDKTRPVMTAVTNAPENAPVCDEVDALGVNYNLKCYEELHKKFPDKCVFASECCATGTSRGWYDDDCAERALISGYDRDAGHSGGFSGGRERTWKFMCEREWILGEYQWIAVDHRGETVWPRICSQSGAIDLYLQKKDAFYQNQSHWTDKPMVHILPHWNFSGREGENIKVFAYTNCTELELFLNGKSLGVREIEKYGHGEWDVCYEPGTLKVEGRIDGKTVCTDEKVTSGKAAELRLVLENSIDKANGTDVALLTCYTVDEDGREVPDAAPFVSFNANKLGKVIGTGSDITDHVPPHVTDRKMRAGRISVAVRVGNTAGELKVYASSDGLKGAVLTVSLS